MQTPPVPSPSLAGKGRSLTLLALAVLFSMSLWFSASAVVPQLTTAWGLSGGAQAWLTMSVQIGFVAGALLSAVTNLADRVPARLLVAASALLGALFTAAIPLFDALTPTLILRFLTGVTLAGVYPPGMKIMATWCREDRGLCIGILVGALAVGSASPHLISVLPELADAAAPAWQPVLLAAAGLSLVAALLAGLGVREGPFGRAAARFHWRHAAKGVTERPLRLANFGYLGHMWELYAMWTWVPILLLAAYQQAEWGAAWARLAGFAVVAIGGLGSVLAGRLADRWGRTRTTSLSLLISGACALLIGPLFGSPALLTALALVWGFVVVADSAQFSAAVSELCDPRFVGTALTVQTSLGFLLTLFTIRMIPPLQGWLGWEGAFAILALGPVFGLWSMVALRRLPEARSMAGGNR